MENKESGISRCKFLGSTAALAGGVLLKPLSPGASAYVAGSDVLKLALVGSGARGAGAVRDAIQTEGPVELVAMAVHSGGLIEWDEALNSDVVLVPEDLSFNSRPPVMPLDDGNYPFPVPRSKQGIV